jgi:hypothetical protein
MPQTYNTVQQGLLQTIERSNEVKRPSGAEELCIGACLNQKELVDVTGIEPVTLCLQRLDARKINDLQQLRSFTTCYDN